MCVFLTICDASPGWHGDAVTCTAQIFKQVEGREVVTERMVRLYLSAWLLTVNMKLLFSKHSSGKGNLCVFAFLQRGDTEPSEGWERCWEWRQTTHHLIMLECATTLCIFSVALVMGVVIVQTVRVVRAWQEGRPKWQFDGGKKNRPYFEVWDLSNCGLISVLRAEHGNRRQIFFCFCCCLRNVLIWNLKQ